MENYDYLLNNTHFKIHEVNYTTVNENWNKVVSIYPYNRIYLVTDGFAVIYLKNQVVNLEPGYLYFLPAFGVVKSNCKKSMTHFYIHFQTKAVSITHDLMESFDFFTKIKADSNSQMYFQIAAENRFPKSINDQLKLEAALKLLLAPFIINTSQKDHKNELFFPVLKYIEDNIYKEITITKLSSIINLNRSYFSIIFKETFGVSPKVYILNLKLRIAQTMLLEKTYNINEISEKLGFKSNMYFSRLFKSKLNMNPSDYKKQFINK